MYKKAGFAVLVMAAVALSGCAKKPRLPVTSNYYAPHSNSVFVTRASIQPASSYEVIARITMGRKWYGSSSGILRSMADRARKRGADAIIEVKTWHRPSGFAWAAPFGSGTLIKITNEKAVGLGRIQGSYY